MPTIKLTQAAADKQKAPAEGRKIFWDNQCPGFGLRITASDARSWVAMYRVRGKAVMETIGTLTLIPAVADARARARASFLKAREGVNPVEVRRKAETEEKAKVEADALTFAKVAERFLREHVERNSAPSYSGEVRRILEHDVLPRWGQKPIRNITKHDVNELLDAKASRRERTRRGMVDGATVQANRTLTRLRTLFRWAADMDLIAADPTAGVRQRTREKARDRALTDDEIRWFWNGCDKLGWPFGPLFKLLLLTAQRRDEVGDMRWSELDIENRTWTIPRERAKNDRAHEVHLSTLAVEIIENLPRQTSPLIFTTNLQRQVSGYSRAKDRLDQFMTEQLREERGDSEAALGEWILHDLRRTATTGMAALNFPPHVVDKILNHVSGAIRGVAAIYNRHAYLDERKAALEAWGRYVEALVRPVSGNIVPLRARL
ncbi:MAG: tyrosine-type recombinase/integrase [Terriglobia bacterium]